ncbi:alpha/beta fold hydrolase [Mycobacterium sp. IDR2000157661]|uniref:alpha/beta fold hydrolase n=1 Tax=Mycobacterium sp. IDR2000157661 TaxID=2867005 RepID=UPI001EEF0DB1|nr:alpha/beta hydrolase [Mycobacterium sp. IDR2000157661]ULE34951.1 alpha/beta hydrolase [Mycobacterium sp. IDR2000157661]
MNVRERNNVRVLGAEGDGVPTLMLAHGFGCDQNMWRLVAAPLSRRYRIVLFDHAGSGRSDPSAWDADRYATLDSYARDVLDIVDELELRDVVFVGHSVAAMMGVLAACARPEAFAKLVLVAPSPRYIDDGDYRGGFSRADIDDLLESLDSNYLGWSQAIAPTIMGASDRPELAEELAESFCRTDPACARVFARTTFLSDNRADLPLVAVPTLVLECAEDAIAPTGVGAYVAQQITSSHLITLDTDGHCPQLTLPEATAAAIASFVDGTS